MRRVLATTLLLSGALMLTACGGSDDTATPSTSTSTAPEDVTTSPAAVKTGLEKIVTIAAGIKTDVADKTKATAGYESIEPVWSTIEGTVKQNDSDAYLALEDAFAVLKNAAEKADATLAAAGADAVSKTVSAYLARFPA